MTAPDLTAFNAKFPEGVAHAEDGGLSAGNGRFYVFRSSRTCWSVSAGVNATSDDLALMANTSVDISFPNWRVALAWLGDNAH